MTLRVGLAHSDITPPLGVELAGFGPHLRRRATHVVLPLRARAVAVDDDHARWVLVACDLLGVDAGLEHEIAVAVKERTGFAPAEIVVHATHTHSAPATVSELHGWGEIDPVYRSVLPGRVADACERAIADLAPARLALGSAPLAGFAYDRMHPSPGRTNDAALAAGWITDRPDRIDAAVDVLRIDRGGAPTGFVVRYSCHPVVCSAQPTGIHGDFPARALQLVEAEMTGVMGVFVQGALGDIDPVFSHGEAGLSEDALDVFGRRFARAVVDALAAATPDIDGTVDIRTALLDDALPPIDRATLVQRQQAARTIIGRAATADSGLTLRMAAIVDASLTGTIERLDRGAHVGRPIVIRALRIGSLGIATSNLENFHVIQRRVRSTHLGAWVLSTTGPYRGYCPEPAAFGADAVPYPAYEMPYYLGLLPFASDIAPRVATTMVSELDALWSHSRTKNHRKATA